jgi:hypothetical protein
VFAAELMSRAVVLVLEGKVDITGVIAVFGHTCNEMAEKIVIQKEPHMTWKKVLAGNISIH